MLEDDGRLRPREIAPIVLKSLYGERIVTLLSLVEPGGDGSLSPPASLAGVAPPDAASFADFLAGTLVALPSDVLPPRIEPNLPMLQQQMQSEVVHRAIELLLLANPMRPNVLAHGYRRCKEHGSLVRTGTGAIENIYPNTLVNHAQTASWSILLARTGQDFMLFLLTECDIFVSLPNRCFFQLAGYPATERLSNLRPAPVEGLTWLHDRDSAGNRPRKRTLNNVVRDVPSKRRKHRRSPLSPLVVDQPHTTATEDIPPQLPKSLPQFCRKPSALLFGRSTMLYARAAQGHKGRTWLGLPRHHLLSKSVPGAQSGLAAIARVFPRLFGLDNVFTSQRLDPKMANCAAWGFSESKSAFGEAPSARRALKRLRSFLPLWERVLRNHQRTNYSALLDRHCTSPRSGKDDQRVLDEALPVGRVVAFIRAASKRVFPSAVWGGAENEKRVLSAIDRFIRLGRNEDLSLHDFCQGIKIKSIAWMFGNECVTSVSRTTHLSNHDLLSEILWWFVQGFLIPLVRTCFYVTESSGNKNRLFYFRQDRWQKLVAQNMPAIRSTFVRVNHTQVLRTVADRPFAFSYVRLLPKEAGMRPIVNLRRRFSTEEIVSAFRKKKDKVPKEALGDLQSKLPESGSAINTVLNPAFQVLTFEKNRSMDSCAGAVLGLTDIYVRLKDFRCRIADNQGQLPRLYFAKVDVTQAFDTIDQALLMDVLRGMLLEDEYVVNKFGVLFPSSGCIRKSFERKARSADGFLQFSELAAHMAQLMRNAVFVDQVGCLFKDRDDILYLIEEHILNNLVKVGNKFYRQASGIPQGSVLSTLLCNFFYADLVRNELSFTSKDDGLLMRFVDDFLYITTQRQSAELFVKTMHGGFPRYGCRINASKTLVNFDFAINGASIPRMSPLASTTSSELEFPWCGHRIGTSSLNVHADYARYFGNDLSATVTQETAKRGGSSILTKLMQFLKPRIHALYLDCSLNSRVSVRRNLSENFSICAMKLHAYLRKLPPLHPGYLYRAIDSAIKFAGILAKTRTRNAAATSRSCTFELQSQDVEWLGWRAFSTVLQRKQTRHADLLQMMSEKEGDLLRTVSAETQAQDRDLDDVARRILY